MAEINGNLDWKARLDTSEFNRNLRDLQSQIEKAIKDGGRLSALPGLTDKQTAANEKARLANEKLAASIDLTRARTENALAAKLKTEESTKRQIALNEKLSASQKKPIVTQFSDSNAEVAAANRGRASGQVTSVSDALKRDGAELANITQKTTEQGQKAKSVLDTVSGAYRNVLKEGLSAFGGIDPVTQKLLNSLVQYQGELDRVKGAQKELSAAFRAGELTESQYTQGKAALVGKERELREEISKSGQELRKYNAAQQQDVSSIAAKTARLSQLKQEYDQLSEAERRNVSVGGQIRSEYQKIQKEVGNLNNSLSGTKSGGIGSILGKAASIGAGLGIYFGTSQLISFGKELFDIAKKAEGIEIAFSRVGSTALLTELRTQTRGLVADLDLERLTVKAANFNIPVERLGTLLNFATQRSRETGESVEYLTESIVTGLGRKSVRILDNLGVSVIEIQDEVRKTGDFTTAFANIVDRDMNMAGTSVDTLADKSGRLSTYFSNLAQSAADALNKFFNPDSADPEKIVKLTDQIRKNYSSINKEVSNPNVRSNVAITRTLSSAKAELAKVEAEIKKVSPDNGKTFYSAGYNKFSSGSDERVKAEKERLKALQNVRSDILKTIDKYDLAERTRRDLLSDAERQKRASDLRDEAANIVVSNDYERKRKANLLKLADQEEAKTQKSIDKNADRESKQRLAEEKRRNTQFAAERKRTISEIDKAETESLRKTLSRNDEEIQAIRDKYATLRAEAKKSGLGSGQINRIDNAERRQIGSTQYDQGTRELVESLEKQKALYAEFEQFRVDFGDKNAKERYGKEIDTAIKFTDVLQIELAKINAIDPLGLSSGLSDRRKAIQKELDEQLIAQQKFDDARLKQLIDNTQTAKLKEAEINRKYDEDLARLRAQFTGEELADREAKLSDTRREELAEVKQMAFQETQFYKNATLDISNFTRSELRRRLQDLKKQLKDTDLTPEQRRLAKQAVNNTQQMLSTETSEAADNAQEISNYAQQAAGSFRQLAGSVADIAPGLADTLDTMGDLVNIAGDAAGAFASFASGDIIGGITKGISAIAGIFTIGAKARASEKKAREEADAFNLKQFTAEFEINKLYRERQREQVAINQLKYDGIAKENELLSKQAKTVTSDYDKVFRALQGEQFVTGQKTEKYGGLFGIGRKTRTVDILGSLGGKTYDQLNDLFIQGRLSGRAKELFQTLQNLRQEGQDIDKQLADLSETAAQVFTGTTADNIRQSIRDGFGDGKRTVQDFAEFTEEIVRNAMLNALEYQALEAPIKELYAQFATDAQSGGALDASEIARFREGISKTIKDAAAFADEITKATGVSLAKPGASQQTGLAGAVKGITSDQADVLAGTLNGQRLLAVEANVIARQNLAAAIAIENNTRRTADGIDTSNGYLKSMADAVKSTSNGIRAGGLG